MGLAILAKSKFSPKLPAWRMKQCLLFRVSIGGAVVYYDDSRAGWVSYIFLPSQVLSFLTSLDDLWATIRAAPVLYQQYRADRKNILRNAMRNILGDKAPVDACAVLKASPPERPPDLEVDLAARQFMGIYPGRNTASTPSTMRKTRRLWSRSCASSGRSSMRVARC
jgi:hypothetical protein